MTPAEFEALKARGPRVVKRRPGQPEQTGRNQQVRDLRALGFTYAEIGETFGVTAARAFAIVNGRGGKL